MTAWKGVRYAAPPIGDLRWRAPEPPEPWTDVADATRFGPVCPQPVDPRIPIDLGAPQGEDCLTLNVWASSDTAAGDAQAGDGVGARRRLHPRLGEPAAVRRAGAGRAAARSVVVTVNYRLGAFGFLDLSEFDTRDAGSTPISDCATCWRRCSWVRDNIAAFGGDPDRVTLFGESAGAGIVTTLLTSPAAAGLFCRAIAQSSPATSVYDASRAHGESPNRCWTGWA